MNCFRSRVNRQGSLYSFLYDFHLFLFLVTPSFLVAVQPCMEWNPIKKNWLVTKLHEQQNSSFGLIKFIWLCGLEREYFASSTNWTRIHTQTIKIPRLYFCHQNKRTKVERTYKNWIIQSGIWKGEGWESRTFMFAFYCIFFWKSPLLLFHPSY